MKGEPELVALVENREMGRVRRDRNGRLSFTYSEDWRTAADAFPLSLSMPLALGEHGHAKIDPYLWGLLPDNEQVLDKWGRKFHVSARNAFGLVAHVGEDAPGAVQFVRPGRVEALRRASPADIDWLTEAMIAERLRALRADHGAWRLPRDTGQFSLAGAQPKTALLFLNGRWGLPSGRVPTTHILKPPTGEFDGHAENEHFCLELARALGFAVPNSRVMRFEDQIAIVVERYDRVQVARAAFQRIHQEDICQALAIPPTRKYESEGGPGVRQTVELLRTYSTKSEEDIEMFLDAVALNWLIAGTDAHAKNYAVLIGGGGSVRPGAAVRLGERVAVSGFRSAAGAHGDEDWGRIPAPRHRTAPVAETRERGAARSGLGDRTSWRASGHGFRAHSGGHSAAGRRRTKASDSGAFEQRADERAAHCQMFLRA